MDFSQKNEDNADFRTLGLNESLGAVPEGCRPETAQMYAPALELYGETELPVAEICRQCGVSVRGFARYVRTYHRHLMLARNGISCSPEDADNIKLRQRRGQYRKTHDKYREAIEACDSMDYIECNVSEIAREFGLSGTNLARQLRTHYPEVLEFRERTRQKLGIADNLPRGSREWCRRQYAEAVEMLRSDSYITAREAAELCNVSYTGLKQHLVFYHSDLVDDRMEIRGKALRRKVKGEITGRGTRHVASPKIVEKYAEALELFRTTPMSARQIALKTNVPVKGFYEYLNTWHSDLKRRRAGISGSGETSDGTTEGRRYSLASAAKYADAIAKLREGQQTMAGVAAEFGLHPDCFRQYLKEHCPELYASVAMTKNEEGRVMSKASLEKYSDAIRLYETTGESLRSIASRLGFNYSALRQFIGRNFPALVKRRQHNSS